MIEQLNIFDQEDSKPCRYRFNRYIGQKVAVIIGAYPFHRTINGTVVGIGSYYTDVKTKEGIMVATPYSLSERD